MNHRGEPKFLVDFMLGRLAKWLRALGYDAVYSIDKNKSNIILQSLKENRILVTRNHGLSRKRAWQLVLVRSDRVEEQLKHLIHELRLTLSQDRLFTRCTVCNGLLDPIRDKEEIKDRVPEYVYKTQNDFARCATCGRIYWMGTHRELILKDLARAGIKL